jgi:hypothetical protein
MTGKQVMVPKTKYHTETVAENHAYTTHLRRDSKFDSLVDSRTWINPNTYEEFVLIRRNERNLSTFPR